MADAGVGGGAAGGKVGVGVGVGTEVAIMVGDSDVESAMVGVDGKGRLDGRKELAFDGDGGGAADGKKKFRLAALEVGAIAGREHGIDVYGAQLGREVVELVGLADEGGPGVVDEGGIDGVGGDGESAGGQGGWLVEVDGWEPGKGALAGSGKRKMMDEEEENVGPWIALHGASIEKG